MGRIVERYKKNNIQREEMCLPDLKKQIKKRKWLFLSMYCAFLFFTYIGFILTVDVSQIIALLFLSLMILLFATISFIDFLFTRLLYYLKFNEE